MLGVHNRARRARTVAQELPEPARGVEGTVPMYSIGAAADGAPRKGRRGTSSNTCSPNCQCQLFINNTDSETAGQYGWESRTRGCPKEWCTTAPSVPGRRRGSALGEPHNEGPQGVDAGLIHAQYCEPPRVDGEASGCHRSSAREEMRFRESKVGKTRIMSPPGRLPSPYKGFAVQHGMGGLNESTATFPTTTHRPSTTIIGR